MNEPRHGEPRSEWGAVFSMGLGVFGLVTSEFLPASLLTPMAADLQITEGLAGQAVTATAAVALITSLLLSTIIRGADRRNVLLALSILLIASNLVVAFAPNLPLLLLGRVLLGVSLGGFWTMATALAMRLVPEEKVPRALSIIFAGVSGATVLAAPVGSYLGEIIGWRSVFLIAAALSLLALAVQFATLPKLPAHGRSSLKAVGEVLTRPNVGLGMIAVTFVFTGHFAFFTYIRPFLETVTRVEIGTVSMILLGFGIANFAGTFLAGPLIARSLRFAMIASPLLMGLLGAGLVLSGAMMLPATAMVAVWGFAFGIVPVAWSTWLTRTTPDQAETAGGLLVAGINLAIATGAAAGGAIFDASGATSVFMASSITLFAAALLILLAIRRPRSALATA